MGKTTVSGWWIMGHLHSSPPDLCPPGHIAAQWWRDLFSGLRLWLALWLRLWWLNLFLELPVWGLLGLGLRRLEKEWSAELVDLPERLGIVYLDLASEGPDEFTFEVRKAPVVLVEWVPVDLVPDLAIWTFRTRGLSSFRVSSIVDSKSISSWRSFLTSSISLFWIWAWSTKGLRAVVSAWVIMQATASPMRA